MLNLVQEQKFELADLLLACPQLSTASGRVTVAGQLSARIHNNIRLGATNTAREEVVALVDAAANVEQGIAELTSVLSFFDGGSIAFEAVQVYVDALGFGGLLPFNSNMLPARNPKFVGREQELASLHKTLQDTSMVAVTALHGLGGVGKTSLAIQYIYRHQKAYNLIVWLSAENRLTLELEFIGLLSELGLPDMPSDTEENRAAAVLAVKKELGRRGKGWLLVFDNAEQPEDVAAFRPGGAAGHVIVTSRNVQMGKLGSALEVDVLTKGDALALLASYCCYPVGEQASAGQLNWRDANEKAAAERLVAELGYLALAITQAGAYIQATKGNVAGYLAKFEHAAIKLFSAAAAKPLDYNQKTVATTWQLSFEAVEKKHRGAAELMNMLAFFAPDNIKLAWLSVDKDMLFGLPDNLVDMLSDGLELDAGLTTLFEYSLIARQDNLLSVHRLVQMVTRDSLIRQQVTATSRESESSQAASTQLNGAVYWYNCVAAFLATKFPNETEYTNLTECDSMISHLQTLIDYYNKYYTIGDDVQGAKKVNNNSNSSVTATGLDLAGVGTLFARAANYYYKRFFYDEAYLLFRQAIAIGEKTLGNDHLQLAVRFNNLANLLHDNKKYEAAGPLYKRAIAIAERTLGSDHPDVAIMLGNLANLLTDDGDYATAKTLFERIIAITERTLGSDHPDLAIQLNNLAGLLQETRDYAEARPLYERAITITEQTLGKNHPQLATLLNSFAALLTKTGDFAAARPLYERAIAILEEALGSWHLDLATSLNNFATLLWSNKEYDAARPLYERAVAILEEAQSTEHLDMANILRNFATLLWSTGESAKALPLLEKALNIFQKKLGTDHPKTIETALAINQLESELTGDLAE